MDALETPRLDFFPIVAPAPATNSGQPAAEPIPGDFAQALAQAPATPVVAALAIPETIEVAEPTEVVAELTATDVGDWSTSPPWVTSSLPAVTTAAPIVTSEPGPVTPAQFDVVSPPVAPSVVIPAVPVVAPLLATIITQHLPTATSPSSPTYSFTTHSTTDDEVAPTSTPIPTGLVNVLTALPVPLVADVTRMTSLPTPNKVDDVPTALESPPASEDDTTMPTAPVAVPPFVVYTLPVPVPTAPPKNSNVATFSDEPVAGDAPPAPAILPVPVVASAAVGPAVRLTSDQPAASNQKAATPTTTVSPTAVQMTPAAVIGQRDPIRATTAPVSLTATSVPADAAATQPEVPAKSPVSASIVPTDSSRAPSPSSASLVSPPQGVPGAPTPLPMNGVANGSAATSSAVRRPAVSRAVKTAPIKHETEHEPPSSLATEPVAPSSIPLLVPTATSDVPIAAPVETVAAATPTPSPSPVVAAPVSEPLPAVATVTPPAETAPASASPPITQPRASAVNDSPEKKAIAVDLPTSAVDTDVIATPTLKPVRPQPQHDVPAARATGANAEVSPPGSPRAAIADDRRTDSVTVVPQRVDLPRPSPAALDFGDPVPMQPAAQLVQRLGDALGFAQESGQELSIRVTPPQFGPIVVEVRMHEGSLTARVETHSTLAHEIITEHLPQLQESLAARGATLDRIDVVPVESRLQPDRQPVADDPPMSRESNSQGWMSSGTSERQGADSQDQPQRRPPRPQPLPSTEPTPVAPPANTGRPMELQGLNVRV